MKAAELRQKDVAGIEAEVKELQKAHFGLRMQKGTQQLNNTQPAQVCQGPGHVNHFTRSPGSSNRRPSTGIALGPRAACRARACRLGRA